MERGGCRACGAGARPAPAPPPWPAHAVVSRGGAAEAIRESENNAEKCDRAWLSRVSAMRDDF